MRTRMALGSITVAVILLAGGGLEAQQDLPLAPNTPRGQTVSPFFEGWFENPDGTYTFSFGYFNRNTREMMEIPIGPDNFLEPAEYDGDQPTVFDSRRERGVFTVTVPGEFAESGGTVVWTLRNRGQELHVPARIGVSAYELGYGPMAMGSLPPKLSFDPDGPGLHGPMSVVGMSGTEGGEPIGTLQRPLMLTGSVDEPLELETWTADNAAPDTRDPASVSVSWARHRGPAPVEFEELEPTEEQEEEGRLVTLATFTEPGEYLLRARASNFSAPDSSSGDQCCWSNGYVVVEVAP